MCRLVRFFVFFFTDPPTTAIYTLSLHDALPIYWRHVDIGCQQQQWIDRRPEIDSNTVVESRDAVVDLDEPAFLSGWQKRDPQFARHFEMLVPLRLTLLAARRVGGVVLQEADRSHI